MQNTLSDIAYVLHDDFVSPGTDFIEKDAKMKISVDKDGCQCVVYKFDKKMSRDYRGGLFPFFAKNEGVCQICDYMVFALRDGQLYCLLIELKRGKAQTMPQLRAATLFAKYVVDTINPVCNKSYNPKYRLVSIHEIKLRKKGTGARGIKYDQENHCIVRSDKFPLKMYLI